MNSITKETLIPVGLVISIALLAFNAGKSSNNIESIENRVHAIEADRADKIKDYGVFQREVIERLTRIEEEVSHGKRR